MPPDRESKTELLAETSPTEAGSASPMSEASGVLPKSEAILELFPPMPVLTRNFRVGIVAASTNESSLHILAIHNPASLCEVTSVCLVDTVDNSVISSWCTTNHIKDDEILIRKGHDGFQEMLQSSIDGIYLMGPIQKRGSMIESILRAGKHVLVDDPLSNSIDQFASLINTAHQCRCHLQDTTTFLFHHANKEFLGVVWAKSFGDIQQIESCFDINPDDARYHGIIPASLRGTENQGCIGSLTRYCLIVGVLIYSRVNRKPVSCRVLNLERDECGKPLHAICRITFDGGCSMTIDTCYVTYKPCYRLYEKEVTKSGDELIKGGTAVDIEGGPWQGVMVWRRFVQLSTSISKDHSASRVAYELSYSSIQSQNIVKALMKSIEARGAEIMLDELELDIPVS